MGATIIVADDSREITSLLAEHLAAMGHSVAAVDDGVKLLFRALELGPDLIVTDVHMPGGFGSDAYSSLRQHARTKDIPVLFISAQPMEGHIPEAPSIRCLQKPLDHRKFAEAVAELLPPAGRPMDPHRPNRLA